MHECLLNILPMTMQTKNIYGGLKKIFFASEKLKD